MFNCNGSSENKNRNPGFTLEIRSQEGELWFLRSFPAGRAKNVVDEIMSTRGFWNEGWTLVVRPFNEETDLESIGDLKFLDDRTRSLL